jgi:hypothetical protein
MFSSSTVLAVFGLATLGAAHMKLVTPKPFGESTLDNSPLAADGSDFPCKQRSGVYSAEGASNTMPLGSTQTVSFVGSAVHGGGSCQFSVTYDEAPTASSKFKVIHSVEGGCPRKGVTGNDDGDATAVDPDTYSFTVPTTLPTGTATFAWTWFNKVGNREMYMNCAPMTITAASSKRSPEDEELMARNITQLMERDQTAFDALPDMFVAQIGPSCSGTGSCSQCSIPESHDVLFPTPGSALDTFGDATSAYIKPTGASCGVNYLAGVAATGAAPVATGGASSAAIVASSAPAVTPTSSAPVGTNTALSGGVFATIPTTSTGSQATSAPAVISASSAAASQPASSPAAVASTPVSSASTPASTGTTGSGSAMTAGTACTTEGMWNCVGGTSFQQCASGTWSVVQPLAAGTSCTAGQSTDINIVASGTKKRSVRFSNNYIRRNLQSS